jgi:hypothetical protein
MLCSACDMRPRGVPVTYLTGQINQFVTFNQCCRIRMFWGHPDPFVRDTNPDPSPSIVKQNFGLLLLRDFFYLF